MLLSAVRAMAVVLTATVPFMVAELLALSSGERTAIGVAGAAIVLGVAIGTYCIARVSRVERIARAGLAKANRLAGIIGVDGDGAPPAD